MANSNEPRATALIVPSLENKDFSQKKSPDDLEIFVKVNLLKLKQSQSQQA
jgi:hypothetical protein